MRQFYKNWLRALVLLLCVFCSQLLFAQDRVITGKVTAEKDSETLPGVTVGLKNKTTKTVTDANGNFRITGVSASDILVFSFIGFTNKEIPASTISGTAITVRLSESVAALNEVVVVGYGTQKRSDITGSVVSVDKKRLEDLPNTNFAQALQGSIPGISVEQNSAGAEGNSATIRIRGQKSIRAETQPLIILDGIPYNGGISDINPPDIESIEVLKDASAAAIYGSRGSNGVILVTTKKGSKGKPVITYDGFYGVQKIANLPDILSPAGFLQFKKDRELATNPNVVTLSEQAVFDSGNFTDWVDLATRTGSRNQHSLGVRGGSDNTKYYLSTTYLKVKGVAVNDDFTRLTTRINLESNVSNWLTLGTNTQLAYNNRSGLPAAFSGDYGAYRFNPLTTAYNPDGSLTIYPWPEDTFFANPLAPTLAQNNDETYKVISTNYLNVQLPVKGLSYRLNTGIEYTSRDQETYYGRDTRTGVQVGGSLNLDQSIQRNILIENILNYNRTFKKHSIAFTGLYSYQYDNIKTSGLDATGFPNDVLTYYQANVALSAKPSANYTKQTLISQMGRLNYSYNEKYLITLTGRRDGFSGFGANYKYAFFPSVALGWNISQEKFLADNKVLTNLKLRASYGSNGNQAVGAYQTLARLTQRSYVDGGTTLPGYVPTSLANPDLRWETTKSANIGIDFGLFQGRIQGNLDMYHSRTSDLLLDRQISSVHGVSVVTQNIGQTDNKGIELGINSTNITSKAFTWTTNATFTLNRNKIVDLYGDGKDDTANTWFIGKPINVNFDYVYNGVWQTTDDLTKSPQPNTQAGYAKVLDLNGDGKITPQGDKTIIGNNQPSFIFGLGNNFKYKNFSLYVFAQGSVGTSRPNTFYSDNVNTGVRYNTFVKNWWTPNNPTNEYWANALNANIYGVPIVQNDSYMRVKDISLSYDLPAKWLERAKLSRVKVYVNARNLITVTNWKGLDPELGTQTAIPLQKEFIVGLNVSL
jgi:TonB-linked SusC/RagA family outer membrane protein